MSIIQNIKSMITGRPQPVSNMGQPPRQLPNTSKQTVTTLGVTPPNFGTDAPSPATHWPVTGEKFSETKIARRERKDEKPKLDPWEQRFATGDYDIPISTTYRAPDKPDHFLKQKKIHVWSSYFPVPDETIFEVCEESGITRITEGEKSKVLDMIKRYDVLVEERNKCSYSAATQDYRERVRKLEAGDLSVELRTKDDLAAEAKLRMRGIKSNIKRVCAEADEILQNVCRRVQKAFRKKVEQLDEVERKQAEALRVPYEPSPLLRKLVWFANVGAMLPADHFIPGVSTTNPKDLFQSLID